ncbi:putative atp-dependent rna helicase dbp9 protein [Phaeoacremonium minimum UCRPA7]|uniref:RNA helicase n=1 Tax=Phaeoacremonium minimum (strain UCR-PA7) TaxID=1286976 RepID=R8BFN8_PHAM7|nr:putative atp-dependent rna helicase dbp9 protein [Phaeoacremonium minimum UCRPA7]EON98115.1 putative atp-dependent rna helicase dbp9 protein [Phaeoacremonium minimum UCRPA7]
MKRKLDENDEPAIVPEANQSQEPPADAEAETTFADLGLDARLVQAIAKQAFQKPTLVQRKAIPLAIDGKDVLAKAKTGSGKTAAYVLPVLQSVLKRKQTDSTPSTTALILVPTRELADQVFKAIELFSAFCAKDVQAVKLSDKLSDAVQRSLLSAFPDIVISTPARAWQNIDSGALVVDKLTHLVLDEADLVLSYGYDEDLQNVARILPKGVQKILMSATLTAEVDDLKGLFCRDPMLLDLEEKDAEGEGVSQYVVKCAEDEKFLLAYVIFKLQLIKGKCIIFVSDIDRCYRLKLFFEQFGIRSCILNSELPVNSRIHVVEEFNRNVYDIIIASDEHEVLGDEDQVSEEKEGVSEADGAAKKSGKKDKEDRQQKKRRKTSKNNDYGVSRGIDFKNVACVVNFDLPTSSKSYTHRIGRTARGGQTGMALSFVVPKEHYRKHMPTTVETAENDEKILARIIKQQTKKGKEVKPYDFDMKQVDAFRYRMNDALRAVTKVAIREARTRELRQELLKSEKLKRHFEENPAMLHHLRHDGELRTARSQAHLKHVPDYLLPKEGKKALTADEIGFVPLRKLDKKDRNKSKYFKKGKGTKAGGRKSDPLRTFKARRKTK